MLRVLVRSRCAKLVLSAQLSGASACRHRCATPHLPGTTPARRALLNKDGDPGTQTPQGTRWRGAAAVTAVAGVTVAASAVVAAEAVTPAPSVRSVYPELEPYEQGTLRVSPFHVLHYELCGNPSGKPVVFLHGGPGGGCTPAHRRLFDPAVYKIILFDQRGAGRSTPHACLEENTTWHLVDDIEVLRRHLGVDRWQVFGGSWGSTLALAYAEAHPARVSELVLRGIFLLRQQEIDWYYENKGGGASFLFPDEFERYMAPVPPAERAGSLVAAYRRLLTGADVKAQRSAAAAWTRWEMATSSLRVKAEDVERAGDDAFALAFARIENHFFTHRGWFACETQLLDNIDKIRHIPTVIVQGRYDVVCPMRSAWDLHKAWPEAKLRVIADAGHSAGEPGIAAALCDATDEFRGA